MSTYKIYHNDNNIYKRVYTFVNHILVENGLCKEDLTSLYEKDPENLLFANIFNEAEKYRIREDKTNVIFLDEQVHLDDTIETIKKKLISEDQSIAFEEIYLYAQKEVVLSNEEIYQKLTQNRRLELTQERLMQFLLNINVIYFDDLKAKDIYTYDDILTLNLDNKNLLENISIGQRFISLESNYIYTINPFDVIIYDPFLEKYAEAITSTSNKGLLLDSSDLYNNSLYLCTTSEVLQYNQKNVLSEDSCIKIYYPYLYDNNITSEDSFKEKREKFLIKNEKLISKAFEEKSDVINLFYNVDEQFEYKEVGIKMIEFIIHPPITFNIPLEVIFKILHATKEIPLIKYNPAKKQENIYRLYANKIAKSGRKIPYLSKGIIFKLMKSIGRQKRVALYIEYSHKGEIIPITCEFDSNASIYVSAEFKYAFSLEEINEIVKNSVNPIISNFKSYLEQSGYNITDFNNLTENNIEILNLTYFFNTSLKKIFKITDFKSCVAEIWNIVNDRANSDILMRFKRVSNYSEMDAQEAFITDLLNKGEGEADIINRLIENFKLTNNEARVKLAELLSSLQVIKNLYQNSKFKIKNNPGFLTKISRNKADNTISVTIDNINNINYLKTIPMFINSLLVISQSDMINKTIKTKIDSLCKKKAKKEVLEIEDIIPDAEKPYLENKTINIVDNELVFDDEDENKDLLGLLFNLDSDEEEEEEEEEEEKKKKKKKKKKKVKEVVAK